MAGVGEENKSSEDSTYNQIKDDIVKELVNVDLAPILNSDSYHKTVKDFMTKSQNVIKVITKENKVLVDKNGELSNQLKLILDKQQENEAQNQVLISNLQAQINELKQSNCKNASSSSSANTTPKSSVKDLTKNSRKPTTTGQPKITQFAAGNQPPNGSNVSKDPNPVQNQSTVATSNKFDALQENQQQDEEMVTIEDDPDEASLSEDANSDPEFRSKRLAYRQQRKKRKRGNSNGESSKQDSTLEDKSNSNSNNNNPSDKPSDKSNKVLPPPLPLKW
ncbi:uncharacterized protein [Bemisia tabaci]|uniref:uncharacterized protein n=1 Tax=Bemisia tabaci TaxID=7038 RepID=UPI003B281E1D